jgi:hypothetical protein
MSEGISYESNMELLKNVEIPGKMINVGEGSQIIILFDLETGGFFANADILQIAAKYGDYEFSTYITPTKNICAKASEVNKLEYINESLHYNGEKVISHSR